MFPSYFDIVCVDTVPQPPTDVTATMGAFDAQLTWQPNYDGNAQQKYRLRYRQLGHTRWHEVDISGDRNSFMVTHLHPDTEYEFAVVPLNKYGTGVHSQIVRYKTGGIVMRIYRFHKLNIQVQRTLAMCYRQTPPV
jgi:hypothetical protein